MSAEPEGFVPGAGQRDTASELHRRVRDLQAEHARLRVDLDWSYSKWQEREAELALIKRSRMWRSWMAYQALRRALLSPLGHIRHGATVAGRTLVEALWIGLQWCGLALGTGAALSAAEWRRRRSRGRPRSAAGDRAAGPETTRRPRILIVHPYRLHPADRGGGVRVLELVRHLSRHCDIQLLILSRHGEDVPGSEPFAPLVERVHCLCCLPSAPEERWSREPKSARLFAAPQVTAKIRQIVAETAVDIVQLESTELGQYGLVDLPRVKVVLADTDVTAHTLARERKQHRHRLGGMPGDSFVDWMRQLRYELRVTRRADQVHVMSSEAGERVARFQLDGWRRLRVVPNAAGLTPYGWEQSAGAALAGYRELLAGAAAEATAGLPLPAGRDGVDVSVVIPTFNGGVVLERCLQAVRSQRTSRTIEIVCVDSGSPDADVETMRRFGAQVIPIDRRDFDHGLTRDLGARSSRGGVLVFLNQDAVPAGPDWMERLVTPLFAGDRDRRAAVQGGQIEVPDRERRFYWHSAGERFYFTRESKRWIERYFGIGFSTANAAIRRDVWERHPFGRAPIMEDKKWQREVVEAGFAIAEAPDAVVYHTHNYSMRSLIRRCYSEGMGWRAVGELYSVRDLLADLWQPRMALDLWRGWRAGEVRSWAEALFPWLRPLTVFRGNRWGREVRL